MASTSSSANPGSAVSPTTRAAVIDGYGGPEQLHTALLPMAAPRGHEVRLEVGAVAVNPVDLTTRAGVNIPESDARFPMVLGWDVAGTVVATGTEVDGWRVGDRVAAMVFQPLDQRGVYAEHVTLDADLLARVPDRLGLLQAATVPLAGLTASQLLAEALSDGATTLLVNGPLGAVGRFVVVLAAHAGVEVIGVVRAEQTETLLALGAAAAVDRGAFDEAVRSRHPGGVDAAIDLVGGATARSTFDLVRKGGRYATSVPPYVDPSGPFATSRGVHLHVHTVRPDAGRLAQLLDLVAAGVLPTIVEHTFPLEAAADAHRRQAAGGLHGRVVLQP